MSSNFQFLISDSLAKVILIDIYAFFSAISDANLSDDCAVWFWIHNMMKLLYVNALTYISFFHHIYTAFFLFLSQFLKSARISCFLIKTMIVKYEFSLFQIIYFKKLLSETPALFIYWILMLIYSDKIKISLMKKWNLRFSAQSYVFKNNIWNFY